MPDFLRAWPTREVPLNRSTAERVLGMALASSTMRGTSRRFEPMYLINEAMPYALEQGLDGRAHPPCEKADGCDRQVHCERDGGKDDAHPCGFQSFSGVTS